MRKLADLNKVIEYAKPFRVITALDIYKGSNL